MRFPFFFFFGVHKGRKTQLESHHPRQVYTFGFQTFTDSLKFSKTSSQFACNFQAFSTSSEKDSSINHAVKKRKDFAQANFTSFFLPWKRISWWSDFMLNRWCTIAFKNVIRHSIFAINLSTRSSTSFVIYMNLGPWKPESNNWQWFKQSSNSFTLHLGPIPLLLLDIVL